MSCPPQLQRLTGGRGGTGGVWAGAGRIRPPLRLTSPQPKMRGHQAACSTPALPLVLSAKFSSQLPLCWMCIQSWSLAMKAAHCFYILNSFSVFNNIIKPHPCFSQTSLLCSTSSWGTTSYWRVTLSLLAASRLAAPTHKSAGLKVRTHRADRHNTLCNSAV